MNIIKYKEIYLLWILACIYIRVAHPARPLVLMSIMSNLELLIFLGV